MHRQVLPVLPTPCPPRPRATTENSKLLAWGVSGALCTSALRGAAGDTRPRRGLSGRCHAEGGDSCASCAEHGGSVGPETSLAADAPTAILWPFHADRHSASHLHWDPPPRAPPDAWTARPRLQREGALRRLLWAAGSWGSDPRQGGRGSGFQGELKATMSPAARCRQLPQARTDPSKKGTEKRALRKGRCFA